MEWFYDIFDILNDDDDDEPEEELENIIEEYYQDFDFDNIDTNVDDEEMMFENDSLTKHDHEDKVRKQKKKKDLYFVEIYYSSFCLSWFRSLKNKFSHRN
jgi:hypothetical protein